MDLVGVGGAVADVRDEAEFFGFLVHEELDDAEGADRAGGFTKDGAGEQNVCCDMRVCFAKREDTVDTVNITVGEDVWTTYSAAGPPWNIPELIAFMSSTLSSC